MARYTVEAGRGIVRDGVRILTIRREESNLSPTDADAMTHLICSLLNAEEDSAPPVKVKKTPVCKISGLPRAEYQSRGRSYCSSCAPNGAKEVILAPAEWFICNSCSFAVNMAESQQRSVLAAVKSDAIRKMSG